MARTRITFEVEIPNKNNKGEDIKPTNEETEAWLEFELGYISSISSTNSLIYGGCIVEPEEFDIEWIEGED